MSGLRVGNRLLLAAVVLLGAWMVYVQVRHRIVYGHFTTPTLHADVVMRDASIGIPGITKMYEATLTNYGFFPALVEECTYFDDDGVPGVTVAYNIERWDPAKRTWTRELEFAKPALCTTAPLRMGTRQWVRSWLLPGQSLSTGEEATGAREPFRKGDTLRFVVVTDVTGRAIRNSSNPTPSFTLDEQRLDTIQYRVRH
jgi:hypothetical protein